MILLKKNAASITEVDRTANLLDFNNKFESIERIHCEFYGEK